tara:strand:+ start:321 stop:551 length:231 start_codon:yes stop_codon:yes gene_type:complete
MEHLQRKRTIGGFTFELSDNCYECRGAMYYDDEHDQVPEPSLQAAATILQTSLKEDGITTQIEWGEKGWIEIYIED